MEPVGDVGVHVRGDIGGGTGIYRRYKVRQNNRSFITRHGLGPACMQKVDGSFG